MAYESNIATIIGNLTEDPELRFTQGGAAVCNVRVAWNRTYTDRSGQQREQTVFMNASCWRDMAENVAESLHKGDRVVVIGQIKTRSYEDQSGQTKWVTEIDADEIAPSLRWARADVNRASGGSSGGMSSGSSAPPPPSDDDVPF